MQTDFLSSRSGRPWRYDREGNSYEYYQGNGASQLEIVVTDHGSQPTKEFLQRTYADRRSGRPNPILVVALYGGQAGLCGPSGEEPSVYPGVDRGQAERVCEAALDQPDRHNAQQFLDAMLPQLDEDLTGLRNQGLLSTHELRVGVPDREDWADAGERAQRALTDDPQQLVRDLNYEVERLPGQGHLLKDVSDGHERAVAVFLQDDESFERNIDRFVGDSPIAFALNEAEKRNLDYVIGSSGDTLRLYTTNPDAGFGSRGRTDTYVEVNTTLLADEKAAYLWLLFSANALREDGTLHEIMEDSKEYAADLGARLRERIYDDVIPDLAEAIADARDLEDPTKEELDETYRMALVLLYRLLFIAYAEDERFLPRRRNDRYDRRSLKQKARDLHQFVQDGGEFDPSFSDHWDNVMHLTRAIHNGHDELGLPAYEGRLLSEDEDISEAGARLADIELNNAEFGPVLFRLLVDETEEGYQGPVDFRNIGVREFGVIYEGLLESELSVADQPLTLDDEGRYTPVEDGGQQTLGEDGEDVVVEEGEVYLHGLSGERKATGTYYTKSRFVEHLLDHSLEPALEDHIERIDRLREEEGENAAADAFFDIRAADIAMGSGHFLVGAVDRIESRLYAYLTENPLPPVEEELDNLEDAAKEAFADEEYTPPIERGQLLRRQVARRCLYGVDLNPLATELARLSIWVHTFVPGLPLTFLDYNLVSGDSLAGIGTLDEVTDILDVEQSSLGMFTGGQSVMDEIRDDIDELGSFADASAEQVQEARETRNEIEEKLEQVRARFDILAASRIDDEIDTDPVSDTGIDITEERSYKRSQEVLESTDPLHFPAAFPEVFDGNDVGFDVIAGNPPWERARVERHEFWARHYPGLRGMSQREREDEIARLQEERPDLQDKFEEEQREKERRSQILTNGPFPGISGDPDFYIAFSWRFWNLTDSKGNVGVVLPRGAFVNAGSESFRRTVLEEGGIEDLTFIKNSGGWAFEGMEHRYTIGLFGFAKNSSESQKLPIRGPFPDPDSFEEGVENEPHGFSVQSALEWMGTARFPLLPPDPKSVEAFGSLDNAPRLDYDDDDSWRARPHRELDSAMDKETEEGVKIMHFTENPPEDYWPILKGASFRIWDPDTGVRYAWADPEVTTDFLQEKRENSYQYAGSRSAFYEMEEDWVFDKSTLSCYQPRIVLRDVARSTDSRTLITALVQPECFLTDKAPYLLWPRGDERDQAYLLGVLSSIPLDWYTRRFVETNVAFYLFNALPIPRPGREFSLRQRVEELSGRLAAVDDRYADWADAVGVEYGPLDEDTKQEKIYELDAVVAHLYGLTREHVEVIFETFHENWDHEERLTRVLEYYDEWAARLDLDHSEETEQVEAEAQDDD